MSKLYERIMPGQYRSNSWGMDVVNKEVIDLTRDVVLYKWSTAPIRSSFNGIHGFCDTMERDWTWLRFLSA